MKSLCICVDFDGCCVTHEFPEIGRDIGAVPVLKELVEEGHRLILYTMRSKIGKDKSLTQAVEWFKARDIPLWGINKNPEQNNWTGSRKVYANLYIDDLALGVPLLFNEKVCKRPFVDWKRIREILVLGGVLLEPDTTKYEKFNMLGNPYTLFTKK